MNMLNIRPAIAADGGRMWELVRASDALELNSAYCYLLMAKHFGETCMVAERGDTLLGFVMGYIPPPQPDTAFVWQIGVAAEARGQGIAGRLLDTLVDSQDANWLEASVGESNAASRALFNGFARRRHATIDSDSDFINAAEFPGEHETEKRFRIGPLKTD
ncbi:MAG TPA: diaminobutyrate acetyltransferase [Gammaproteobacteria bacterium]|nr:diaminobutyrate acetyltransferase [Gammaproteobacteria bacterium]